MISTRRARSRTCALALCALLALSGSARPADEDVGVRISQDGPEIIVDVSLRIEAPGIDTWNVATDYDHMAGFVSNLQESRILERDGDTLFVMQKGKAVRGPLSFSFENIRRIVLTPYREIDSELVSGDLKSSRFTTRVVDHGTWSEIVNHGEFIPNVWVPPLIGPALIAAETRKQFGELREEILRRKTAGAMAPGSRTDGAPG